MPSRTTKAATLARVRNNQRRCRARKREYVVELERKLQESQVAKAQPAVEDFGSTLKRLEDENRKLKLLLGQVGVSKTCIDAHLKGGCDACVSSDGSHQTDEQPLSYVQGSRFINEFETQPSTKLVLNPGRASPSPSFSDLLNEPFLGLSEDFQLFESAQSISINRPVTAPTATGITLSDSRSLAPFTCLNPNNPDSAGKCDSWCLPPPSLIPGDSAGVEKIQNRCGTTLCTVAYEMVRQHNKKGLDMVEIGIRLWNGFVKGDRDGEGCKVENNLLFSVLNYIQG